MLGIILYTVTAYLNVYKTLKFDYAMMLRLTGVEQFGMANIKINIYIYIYIYI